MIQSYCTGKRNGKRILEAALLLNNFCMEQHWRCGECPFYKHDGGNCLLYGFPHVWNPAEWEEVGYAERHTTGNTSAD